MSLTPPKTILITGGNRCIGKATARLAGARGWSVAISYSCNRTAAQTTVNEVIAAGGKAISLKCDVTSEADVLAAFDSAEANFGRLDGVVISADIVAPAMTLAEMSVERLKRTFDINVLGAYICAREAARRLGRQGSGGSIVLVSSAAARLGSPFEFVDYAGSKAALDTLTIGLAKELGPQGIRVNAVRPGLIGADADAHASRRQQCRPHHLGGHTPLRRPGRPEEVGELILWLLDDTASYTTGALIDVTGGR